MLVRTGTPILMMLASITLLFPQIKGHADQVKLEVATAYSKVVKTTKRQNVWVRVGLTGFELEKERKRAPVNVAIVLDRSGSMQGQKIQRAKEAAISAIDRLDPDDIVSVITYDTQVNVLVPATKATDKRAIKQKIAQIGVGGNTALFAGVSKGAAEVRKFLAEDRVNRIILLSDGLANVGPSTPGELGRLGGSLMKEGISVSTFGLGLGYNEDLMTKLAMKSGGNHSFIENAAELADVFNREFDNVMSVAAQDVKLKMTIPEGIRPVRVLGNDADINGQTIVTRMAQIYSKQNRFILVELELPWIHGPKMDIGTVSVTYRNMKTNGEDTLTGRASVETCKTMTEQEKSVNRSVLEDVVAMVANEQNKLATSYLDKGQIEECIKCLDDNSKFLKDNSIKLNSDKLKLYFEYNSLQRDQILSNKLNTGRKAMRAVQLQLENQQTYQQKVGSGKIKK